MQHRIPGEFIRGYTNQALLRGLIAYKPAEAGFVCLALDFQSEGKLLMLNSDAT